MPGIQVRVLAAYASYSPGNMRRSSPSSKGIRVAKNLHDATANPTAQIGFISMTCVPTDHVSHPR
jgi:hypothetical protein